MEKNQKGEQCESFTDGINEIIRQWRAMPSRRRATLAKTGVVWEAMTLGEVMEAMAEDEEDE